MLDQAIRFGAILKRKEFAGDGNLLEVGSGAEGIGAFTDDPLVGVDIHFETSPHFTAVKASATALPFSDGAFSRVVCSDVLEHLRSEERTAAIGELVRVTKGTLFLACPTGRWARLSDCGLRFIYRLPGIRPPEWLVEHRARGLPDAQEIRRVLRESGVTFSEFKGESCLVHLLVGVLISTRFCNKIWKILFSRKPGRAKKIAGAAFLGGILPYRRLWLIRRDL